MRREDVAKVLNVATSTVKKYSDANKLKHLGFVEASRSSNLVLYKDIREASRNAFIDPNDATIVRESAPGNRKNRVASDSARGGQSSYVSQPKPQIKQEAHLRDNAGRAIRSSREDEVRAKSKKAAAAADSNDSHNEPPTHLSVSRSPLGHTKLDKSGKVTKGPLSGLTASDMRVLGLFAVAHHTPVPLTGVKAQDDVREAFSDAMLEDSTPKTGKGRTTPYSRAKQAFETADKEQADRKDNSGQVWGMGDDGDENLNPMMGRI